PGPAPASSDLKLEIVVDGGDGAAFADLPYATLVTDKSDADLIWSMPKGTVEHMVGGVVAENVDVASIKGVVSKWAAFKWLKELNPADASLTSGNQRYAIGDHVKIGLQGTKYPYLTM